LAKLPVALPWHFLKVVLDVVHNVAKVPLILYLQSKRFSSLFRCYLDVLLVTVVEDDLGSGLEHNTRFLSIYLTLWWMLVDEHLTMFLCKRRSVGVLRYLLH
jgi:hypothetical protein